MKDLTVFIIGDVVNKRINYKGELLSDANTSARDQLQKLSIDAQVITTKINEIPSKVDSKLVMFLNGDHCIPNDYIYNVCSLNNIFRSTGIFFGPVYTDSLLPSFDGAIRDHYHRYDLGIDGLMAANITKEPHNYGDISGSTITGTVYNEFNYAPVKTPRGYCLNNHSFLNRVSRKYEISYFSCLYKLKFLTESSLDHQVISEYYYYKGYEEGLKITLANSENKKDEIWKRFIESPELTDYEMPRWLHNDKDTTSVEYLESLIILKFQYQLGLFEGMLNKKLV